MTFVRSLRAAFLSVGMSAVLIVVSWARVPLFDHLELKSYDLLVRLRGTVAPSPAIVLAVVDDKSLAAEGRWPWPRAKFAELVERLSTDKAKVIGFDMAFIEPDRDPQNDLALAEAMKASSAAIVLGYFFRMQPVDLNDAVGQQVIDHQFDHLEMSKYPFILYGQGLDVDTVRFLRGYAPMGNLDFFTVAAPSSGHLMLDRDLDHLTRWMPLIIQGGDKLFPPLALWCAWHYLDKPNVMVKVGPYGVEGIQMGTRSIPTDDRGRLLLNYLGPPQTFPHISVSDILSGAFPPGAFTNRIVLVGATALGIHDLLSTPLSPHHAAVEIHANAIDNLLTQDFLTQPSWAMAYNVLVIILFGTLLGVALPRLKMFKGLLLVVGLGGMHGLAVGWLFIHSGVWLTVVYPWLMLAMASISLALQRMIRQLRQTFRNLQDELAEHKRTEALLRQRESQYRDLVEGSLQGISIVKQDGTRVFANSALARIWGYETPDDLIGQSLWDNIAPHERSLLQTTMDCQLHGGITPPPQVYQTVKQDGTFIWTERLASPMVSDGETVILEAYIDVTERRSLETQLHQAQKMQAIGTLAGGIAHDFNNLLSAILGFTELARQEIGRHLTAERYLDEVLAAGARAKDLIQQLLTFSRQAESRRTPIELGPVIQEVFGLLRPSLPASIGLRSVIDPNAGLVLADSTQIHQVLLNLCLNASHAMRETGGAIEVVLDAVDVTSESSLVPLNLRAGPYVRLRVQDTGQGMAPEVMERIFEPFFTTKSAGEGTGLGLSVVHGIVTRHEGTITVESTPGQGSTFTVYLPRLADPVMAEAEPEMPRARERLSILFVDDEEVLVFLGKSALETLGYRVTGWKGGVEALHVFRAAPQQFDLVMTDQLMPDMNGEALVRALRQLRPDIPIILCTGSSDVTIVERARALGVEVVVMKPWTIHDLNRQIRQVLGPRI